MLLCCSVGRISNLLQTMSISTVLRTTVFVSRQKGSLLTEVIVRHEVALSGHTLHSCVLRPKVWRTEAGSCGGRELFPNIMQTAKLQARGVVIVVCTDH